MPSSRGVASQGIRVAGIDSAVPRTVRGAGGEGAGAMTETAIVGDAGTGIGIMELVGAAAAAGVARGTPPAAEDAAIRSTMFAAASARTAFATSTATAVAAESAKLTPTATSSARAAGGETGETETETETGGIGETAGTRSSRSSSQGGGPAGPPPLLCRTRVACSLAVAVQSHAQRNDGVGALVRSER
jgi:hypothetical protein